jgi:virulence-associated protein VagC
VSSHTKTYTREEVDEIIAKHISDRFRGFGFKTGSPVYEFYPSFDLDDLKEATFTSRSSPTRLPVEFDLDEPSVKVVVTSVRRYHEPGEPEEDTQEYWETADWIVEGLIPDNQDDPFSGGQRVIIYVEGSPGCTFNMAWPQKLPEDEASDDLIRMMNPGWGTYLARRTELMLFG